MCENTREWDERDELEIDKIIGQWSADLKAGICPTCKTKIEEKKQVGRCVYSCSCGHRLYQGQLKVFTQPPTQGNTNE